MIDYQIYSVLHKLYLESPKIRLSQNDQIVIFSDLHLGNGGTRDDFLHNSLFFSYVLEEYYLKNGFKLILNGDIEELQRFSLSSILKQWEALYKLFLKFAEKKSFFKIIGNHDIELQERENYLLKKYLYSGLFLDYNEHPILIFHGHQASYFMKYFNSFCEFTLRYLATPLGIKNFSVSNDNLKKFRTERRVYHFSRSKKLLSIIGHTHRPLFESLSKIDCLKFKIEQLCRDYTVAFAHERKLIEPKIKKYKGELRELQKKKKSEGLRSSLYDSELLIPCVFNSGCAIGKGLTAIEIKDDQIALVYWFDSNRSNKYFNYNGYKPEQLNETDYYRVVLNRDYLDYIFTRIKLLT